MKRKVLLVTLDLASSCEVSNAELRNHVRDAVESWGGSLHPDDPLFSGIRKATVRMFNPSKDSSS